MTKCKECGKTVTGRHYCEPRKRQVEPDEPGLIGGLFEAAGDILEAVVDNLDFD